MKAPMFDEYVDVGLAFSTAQVEAFSPSAVAAVRVNWLVEMVPVVERRSGLKLDGDLLWKATAKEMVRAANWYCVVGSLPGIDWEMIAVDPKAAGYRTLTADARRFCEDGGAVGWLMGWRSDVESELRRAVSLGRSISMTKAERSVGNKVGNAMVQEMGRVSKLLENWASVPVRTSKVNL